MKKILRICAILAAGLCFSPGAGAAPLNVSVPSNAYVAFAGLDWAWGGACPYANIGCGSSSVGDLSYQSTLGWRLPTLTELQSLPSDFAANYLTFVGANVPASGTGPDGATFNGGNSSAAACASPYFAVSHLHCDYADGVAGNWAGLPGTNATADQLYVRTSSDAEAIPEPASLVLLGAGLVGFGLARRRRA